MNLAAGLAGGAGLGASGGLISVNVDDSGIEIDSDTLRLKDNGVTLAKMAGLASGKFILGDGSGDPAAVSMSGDATLANNGAISLAAAQTNVTSLINASMGKIGTATDQEYIDFGTANEIKFAINDSLVASVEAGQFTVAGNLVVQGTTTTVNSTTINISSSFTFEGPADDHETVLSCGSPTADATLELFQGAAGTYYMPAFSDSGVKSTVIAATAAEINTVCDGGNARGTTALADGDGFIHNDNGTMKQTNVVKFFEYVVDKFSGDATVNDSGVVTIAAGAVHHSMLSDDIISGQDELLHADILDADELMISDGGVIKRVGVDSIQNHAFGKVSGDIAIADGGAATIQANAVEGSMLNNNIVSGLDDIGAAIVNTDEMIVSDGGTIKRMDMSRLKTFIGNGTSAVANADDGDTLAVGVNYFSNHGGAESVSLPASAGLTVGESIKIKAGSDCSSTNTLTVNKAGSQTIDGATSIVLESPFAAVELVYVAADTWRVF